MITCENLTYRYGTRAVLHGLSFDLPQGSICALLGPNGAGKSTTLKLLTGLLPLAEGEVRVGGCSIRDSKLQRNRIMGVVPDRLGLFDQLSVEEHLHLTGRLHGLSRTETRTRADQLLRLLSLEHGRDTLADHCSHGMRKKTALAMALIHNPKVLFLDEPFEGVDPVTAQVIHDLLVSLAKKGTTVFFTSHSLALMERIATDYLLLRDGKLAWQGSASALPASLEALYFELVESPKTEELSWLGSRSC